MIKVRFEPEVFSKLYQRAEKEGMHIPALVNQLIKGILNEEEQNGKEKQSQHFK
jgi:hypothetical protein